MMWKRNWLVIKHRGFRMEGEGRARLARKGRLNIEVEKTERQIKDMEREIRRNSVIRSTKTEREKGYSNPGRIFEVSVLTSC